MLIVAGAALVATLLAFRIVHTGFIPPQDAGIFSANVQAPDGISFDEMSQMQGRLADIILKNPNVLGVQSSVGQAQGGVSSTNRSEEHTSELQSLMRISYAVFCLKKKKNKTKTTLQKRMTKTIYYKH